MRKYSAFSLVEMLITIAIIGMVMLIASVTLTTLIKISTVSSNKTRTRNETEFVLELVRRTVRNSNPSDVFVYNTVDARTYNSETELVENKPEVVDISNSYANALGAGFQGNEIHFRPYGYTNWICIAFFESKTEENKGYILKTSTVDLYNQHEKCFDSTQSDYAQYTILLNSPYVDINSFEISYTETTGSNYLFRFTISAEPTDWYLAPGAPVKREIIRQAIVSTEGLMW